MSRGFVKEYEDQWLKEIPPTLNALTRFLTHESNGFAVVEKRSYKHPVSGIEIHEMSNGLSYAVNAEREWYVVEQ